MKFNSAYLLTGGKSQRFGKDKCLATINKKPLLDIVHSNIKSSFNDVYQVGKKSYGTIPFIIDEFDKTCSLNGIVTALRHCNSKWAFIIACDLPLISRDIIQSLGTDLDLDYQVFLPVVNGYLQYTCAFYQIDILNQAEQNLRNGNVALHDLINQTRYNSVSYPPEKVINFTNVNTPDKLTYVEKWINSQDENLSVDTGKST
ncbi:MAG: molybdenum cofactor guanylyltransferase [Candidatus Neomarinimicrobiota bacterium]